MEYPASPLFLPPTQDTPRPDDFSYGAWFSDGVDNLIHAPQLSLNLLAMGHEGTSNANAAALTGGNASNTPSASSGSGSSSGSGVPTAPMFTDDFTSGGAENDAFAASMRAPRSLRALADLDLNLRYVSRDFSVRFYVRFFPFHSWMVIGFCLWRRYRAGLDVGGNHTRLIIAPTKAK
jgi:hypothetical protein